MSEVWTKWEGQVVDGAFPLRRCLGVSDHSGVFLTEDPTHNLANAALKLVPAIPTLAESQLAHWNAAASLAHPRLVRLFSTGRCQLGSLHCLYVVMEYAEQNLAQFLANRALTEEEVFELLPPTLDALGFLHARNLVHGQLKPSNVLVVADQLKLASDTVRPAGEAATSISMLSVYDPPEGRDGSFSTAGDVWALGVTLHEALTRTTPPRLDERSHGIVLAPDFPPACAEVVRGCLRRGPGDRPSVATLQAWNSGGTLTAASAASQPVQGTAPAEPVSTVRQPTGPRPTEPQSATQAATPLPPPPPGRLTIRAVVEHEPPAEDAAPRRPLLPLALAAVALVVVCWGALRLFTHHAPPAGASQQGAQRVDSATPGTSSGESQPSAAPSEGGSHSSAAATSSEQAAPSAQQPPAAEQQHPGHSRHARDSRHSGAESNSTSAARGAGTPSVVHEEIPKVPRSALATIRGHVRVTVRVSVDSSGAVASESLANAGPSDYFARVASQAARKWRFKPAAGQPSRQWLVHFEFSRGGTKAHASANS